MTASAQRAGEPSMEEILASIRRIIADDQSRAKMGSARLVSVAGAQPAETVDPAGTSAAPSEAAASMREILTPKEAVLPEAEDMAGIAPAEQTAPQIESAVVDRDAAPASAPLEIGPPASASAERSRVSVSSGSGAIGDRAVGLSPASPRSDGDGATAKLEAEVAKLVQETFAREASVEQSPPEAAPAAEEAAAEVALAQDTLAQDTFAQDTFAQDALAQDPLAQDPLARDAPSHESLPQEEPAEVAAAYEALPDEPVASEIVARTAQASPREMPADAFVPEVRQDRLWPKRPAASLLSPAGQAEPRRTTAEPGGVGASAAESPGAPSRDRLEMRADEARYSGAGRAEPRHRETQPMLSSETDLAVARAFNSLSRTVLSDNARTLEDLVTEMLRPLLKAWLDDNLPPLVERLVRTEIERVARGRPD